MSGEPIAPLAGLKVIEVANWVAAPSTAAMMADMGADVVKVEPLRGDAMRRRLRQPRLPEGSTSIDNPFHQDNRGKRSLAIALDHPEGPRWFAASLRTQMSLLRT